MFEGQNTGFNAGIAKRLAPRGRPPTVMELWEQRYFRALDKLDHDQARRHRDLMHEAMGTMATKTTIVDGHWAPNPHFGDADHYRHVWDEIGELLGIGPPPQLLGSALIGAYSLAPLGQQVGQASR